MTDINSFTACGISLLLEMKLTNLEKYKDMSLSMAILYINSLLLKLKVTHLQKYETASWSTVYCNMVHV